MTKYLYGVCAVLFAGMLWVGCGGTDASCEVDNINVDQVCETAAECPACEPTCSGNGFDVQGPARCEDQAPFGMQCVCPCIICYER